MDIILEIKVGGETVRLQTRPSGDVEILRCKKIDDAFSRDSYGKQFYHAGGVHDTCIGLIHKFKRAEVAQFLVSDK